MSFLPIFLLLASAQAHGGFGSHWYTRWASRDGDAVFWGCTDGVRRTFEYNYTDAMSVSADSFNAYYDSVCDYDPAIGSVLLCAYNLYDGDAKKMAKFYKSYEFNCKQVSMGDHDASYYEAQYTNATEYETDIEASPMYSPAMPNMTIPIEKKRVYQLRFQLLDDANWYCFGVYFYYLFLIVLCGIHHWAIRTGAVQSYAGPIVNKLRSYIMLPSLFPNGHYEQPVGSSLLGGLLSSRLETIADLGLFVMHMVFWCWPYHQDQVLSTAGRDGGGYFYADASHNWKRLVALRTGIMSYGKVPLLIFFACRNSWLTKLTGIKYSSWLHFHKAVSGYMWVDGFIHTVAFSILHKDVFLETVRTSDYFCAGLIAIVLVSACILVSIWPLRNYGYEIFLYSHIVLAACYLVSLWYHCRTLGWCEYVIAACVIYVYDWLMRLWRMASYGYNDAIIEAVSETSFKITTIFPDTFKFTPGQYGFVYFADSLLWFQNHPFTIMTEGRTITMYVKVKRGITSKIFKQLGNGPIKKKICIEGPYGETAPVYKYDNAVLFAGGGAFTGILDYAARLATTAKPTSVKLFWIARTYRDIEEAWSSLAPRLNTSKYNVEIYLTQEEMSSDDEKKSMSSSSGSEYEVSFKSGRPDVRALLHDSLAGSVGSTAVLGCGPGGMMDTLRDQFTREITLLSGQRSRVEFFDELQVW